MSEATEAFPHTCVIQVATAGAANEIGQPTISWTSPTSTTVACHYQPRGQRELARRQVVNIENPRLFLPDGTAVTLTNRITSVSVA